MYRLNTLCTILSIRQLVAATDTPNKSTNVDLLYIDKFVSCHIWIGEVVHCHLSFIDKLVNLPSQIEISTDRQMQREGDSLTQ